MSLAVVKYTGPREQVLVAGRITSGEELGRLRRRLLGRHPRPADPAGELGIVSPEQCDLPKVMPDKLKILKAAWDRYAQEVGVVSPE